MKSICAATILMLMLTNSQAQWKYKTCTVYATSAVHPERSGLAARQVFNRFGKLVYEKQYGKWHDAPDRGAWGYYYNDTTCIEEQTFFTYIKDTLLAKKITFSPDPYHAGVDTLISLYYYNPNGQLIKERFSKYGSHTYGCCVLPDKYWGDSIVRTYKYYHNGNVSEETNMNYSAYMPGYGSAARVHYRKYKYDKNSRLLSVDNYNIPVYNYGLSHIWKPDINLSTKPDKLTPAQRQWGYDTTLVFTELYSYPTSECITITESPASRWRSDTTVYYYDTQRRIIREKIPGTTYKHSTRIYGYDPDKMLLKELQYDSNGEVAFSMRYTYK